MKKILFFMSFLGFSLVNCDVALNIDDKAKMSFAAKLTVMKSPDRIKYQSAIDDKIGEFKISPGKNVQVLPEVESITSIKLELTNDEIAGGKTFVIKPDTKEKNIEVIIVPHLVLSEK